MRTQEVHLQKPGAPEFQVRSAPNCQSKLNKMVCWGKGVHVFLRNRQEHAQTRDQRFKKDQRYQHPNLAGHTSPSPVAKH